MRSFTEIYIDNLWGYIVMTVYDHSWDGKPIPEGCEHRPYRVDCDVPMSDPLHIHNYVDYSTYKTLEEAEDRHLRWIRWVIDRVAERGPRDPL